MGIILSAGTLCLIVIAVLCCVLAVVSSALLLLSRTSSVSVSHCRDCHAPVWVGGSWQPPYLESRPAPVTLSRNTVTTVYRNLPRELDAAYAGDIENGDIEVDKSVMMVKTPCHRASLLQDSDQARYIFQRSCSTRKKVPQQEYRSEREQEHGTNKLFRILIMSSQRSRVIQLYKNLLHLGREYPQGYDYFRSKCHNAFTKNKNIKGEEQVEEWLAKGDYIIKELEALYMLKKYRTLKRRYYKDEM